MISGQRTEKLFSMGIEGLALGVVTKSLSCRVNTTSGRETKQLGVSFGAIFLLVSLRK